VKATDMRTEAAQLLRAARTERGERREHMVQEAQMWISLAQIAGDGVADVPVPDGTVMRIRTRGGALTVVMEAREEGVRIYPWACLGCGEGRKSTPWDRKDMRKEATRHARECWVLPETPNDAPAKSLDAA
jgi:hypothetical protein